MTGVIESAEPLVVEADSGLLGGTSEAVFSVDRVRRYVLVRLWESVAPMTWIMLNPSTADAFADDPTIKRCMAFARREGCGGINVVNLFAHRSPDPAALRQAADPVGPANDSAIEVYAWDASLVVAAWGCPRRDAATDILADSATEHIVDFGPAGFIIRHPLRERLDNALMDCALHEHCQAMDGPPVQPGRYRATRSSGKPWVWEAIPS